MKCTSCQKGNLVLGFIDNLFKARTCDNCGGNWILIEDFLLWRNHSSEYQASEDFHCKEDALESVKALFCPVTGALMTKFRISAKTDHKVDYSVRVGGVWLDKGEWELLKQGGIAESLNALVTKPWQNKIQAEATALGFSKIYEDRFGAESYHKVKEIREWLQSQEKEAALKAYISAGNPYSA